MAKSCKQTAKRQTNVAMKRPPTGYHPKDIKSKSGMKKGKGTLIVDALPVRRGTKKGKGTLIV